MDFLKKYAGIIAILALVIAGIAIFNGGKTEVVITERAEDNTTVVGALSNSTGFNSIDFQGLGSPTTFGIASCRIPTGTRQTATNTCAVLNNTGQDLYAWVNGVMASTTEMSSTWTDGSSGPRVNGVASTTFLANGATSTTRYVAGASGDFTDFNGSIYNNIRMATGTSFNFSTLTATSTGTDGGSGSPFLWKNGEYAVFQLFEETGAATRCGTTAVNGTGCETATSSRRGFHLDNYIYYNAWDSNR